MIESPFRERPRVLDCPRCGDTLERVSQGVETCTRCEGAWLANATIAQAFGALTWPGGASAWWRRSLQCPACAFDGVAEPLTAQVVGQLIVDRCASHGIWLDHGELGRLIGAPNVVELEALYERIKPGGELPPKLVEQRKRRQADVERRQRELDEYRAKLAAERVAARKAELAAERKARDEQYAAERKRLDVLRSDTRAEVEVHEKALLAVREQVRAAEQRVAASRAQLLELERQIELLDKKHRDETA